MKIFSINVKNDPSKTWKNINNLLRNTDSHIDNSFGALLVNGIQITNKHSLSESFNSFFVTVADKVHGEITIDKNDCDTLHEFEQYDITIPFECPKTSSEEVCTALSNLSNSSAKDVNGFSNKLFKKYITKIIEPISKLINRCFENETFPNCLKIAKVKPLFKSGSKLDRNNYRPVAISPIDSKCFESILLDRLQTH